MDNKPQMFGEPEKFAIRYSPCPIEYNYDPNKYAICHLIVNNTVLGSPTEECYLPTWLSQLQKNREFIVQNKDDLFQKEFDGLTDREIFEIVIKTNETEEEFDPHYLYLPQLNSALWHRHVLMLDETIDSYVICFYILNDKISFIIEEKWPQMENGLRGKFIYSRIGFEYFQDVVDAAIQFLKGK